MAAKMIPIRVQQSLQGEIAKLRRQNVYLRGALADVVTMKDIETAKAHALRTLTSEPALPTDIGHGDVGSAGGGKPDA